MRSNEAVRLLQAHAGAIRAIGATSLYLFGSAARDEAGEGSDLDLFIDYDEHGDFSAIELVRLQNYISDALAARRLASCSGRPGQSFAWRGPYSYAKVSGAERGGPARGRWRPRVRKKSAKRTQSHGAESTT